MTVDVDATLQVEVSPGVLAPLKVADDAESPTGKALPVLDAAARVTLTEILAALGATVTVDGTVELGPTTLAALEQITVTLAPGTLDDIEAQLAELATEETLQDVLVEASATATEIGPTNAAAPATDTATASVNGRLQRIAQNVTTLIAKLPGSLGQKARAASLAVTLSTEDIVALTPPAPISGFATAVKQDEIIDLLNSSVPPNWASFELDYTGDNLTEARFFDAAPALMRTITLGYTGDNLTSGSAA